MLTTRACLVMALCLLQLRGDLLRTIQLCENNTWVPAVIGITSAPAGFIHRRHRFTLWDKRATKLSTSMPLLLYHEERGGPFEPPASVCPVDLFRSEPWLKDYVRELTSEAGILRKNMSRYLPIALTHASSTPFLVRKVAAIRHAVNHVPDGTVVVWLDVDVMVMSPLDSEFFGFVRQHDIMTIGRLPIVSTDPETGVVAIVASARTRRMMNRAVDLYKWGMVDTAARFGAHGDCGSLSLNDISVFKMLISPAKSPACREWHDSQLSVGWFAVGCPEYERGTRWYQYQKRYEANHPVYCKTESKHNQNVSSFNLFKYFAHMKGGNGVMTARLRGDSPGPSTASALGDTQV